ncbi:TPA: hypothetical protein KQG29_001574 [Clostridioides difficile]|nr:hypothetical protein [Clostridioides difficile]
MDKNTSPLDYVSDKINFLLNNSSLSIEDVRHIIIKTMISVLNTSESKVTSLLLNASVTDISYSNLLDKMYPKVNKSLSNEKGTNYGILVDSFTKATIKLYWDEILIKNLSLEELKEHTKNCNTLIYPLKDENELKIKELLRGDNILDGLNSIVELYKHTKNIKNSDKHTIVAKSKIDYILELKKQGYNLISNDTVIAGNNNLNTEIIKILKSVYNPLTTNKDGHTFDNANMSNQRLLSKLGLDYKTVDLWSANIYTKDEDLAFRVFIKEDDSSFRIRVKLPLHVENFILAENKNVYLSQSSKTIRTVDVLDKLKPIPALFSNSDPTLGEVYSSCFFSIPTITSLKAFGINTIYNCIQFVIVKDLFEFKNKNWFLRNYIKQAKGRNVNTEFKDFKNLPLGKKVVPGVLPGDLLGLEFRNDLPQSACLMCGGAGSGKTAMIYSMAIQLLALNDANLGLGALVLIDAKMELPPPWIRAFKKKNIQLYGFDAEILPNSELKKEIVNRKGEKQVVPISESVPGFIGGLIFLKCIFYAIQHLKKKSKAGDDIVTFNKNNISIDGISKLPRTAIIVDELNLLKEITDSFDNGRGKKIFSDSILEAKVTRTSGYNYLLCGQDLAKSVIPASERGNYPYSIVGDLQHERYEYYDINPNINVLKYEDLNCPEGNRERAIVSQGVFYAGGKNSNALVKCMYLPESELEDALDDLEIDFEGMKQFDSIVKYAIKNGFFEDTNNPYGLKTNIVYSALKSIGAITQEEFDIYTKRMFNEAEDSSNAEDTNTILNEFNNIDYREVESVNHTDTTSKNNPAVSDLNSLVNNAATSDLNNLVDIFDNDLDKEYKRQSLDIENNSEMQPNTFFGCPLYNEKIEVLNNPFEFKFSDTTFGTIYAFKTLTNIVTKELCKAYGSIDRIEILKLSKTGIFINGTGFRPVFSEKIIETLPIDIRNKVRAGNIVDFFDLGKIIKFKSLTKLIVEDIYLAETRLRKELFLDRDEPWSILYEHCKNLIYLEIGGDKIKRHIDTDYDEDDCEEYQKYKFHEKVKGALGMDSFNQKSDVSPLGRVWASKPVKTICRAAGCTIGLKSTFILASIFGGWGLVFGAFAGYHAYKNYSKKD